MKAASHDTLLKTLEERFSQHRHRHPDILWDQVLARLKANPKKLAALAEMEKTGGEPDVVAFDKALGEYWFVDCSKESPIGRRSVCYDRQALQARKENKPKTSALDLIEKMGIELLSESQYRDLQKLEPFDTKTSSWILTPKPIRDLGGALFCDRRYETVFVYHNGAESYYAVRGFRGLLRV